MLTIYKHDNKRLTGIIITFVCCVFFAFLFSFRTMPVSEGWYSEYAWQINHGNLPYKDFEYLFMPLYLFIIAGYTRIFGYSIIALRILGIFIFGITGVTIYCILEKVFDNFSAVIASIIAMLYLQSENAQVFYDYIRFHDLFAILTTYFLLQVSNQCLNKNTLELHGTTKNLNYFLQLIVPFTLIITGIIGVFKYPFFNNTKKGILLFFILISGILSLLLPLIFKQLKNHLQTYPTAILCGLFVSMECMIKHSNGFLMITFIILYVLFCMLIFHNNHNVFSNYFKAFLGIVYSIFFSFAILITYLLVTNSLEAFFLCCFQNALNAKGGLMSVLFNWIPSSLQLFWNGKEFVFIIILLMYIGIRTFLQKKEFPNYLLKGHYIIISGFVLLIIEQRYTFNHNLALKGTLSYNPYIPSIVFFISLLLFVVFGIYLILIMLQKKPLSAFAQKYYLLFPILGAAFAQGYGSGMSGGLATSQTVISFALITALSIHFLIQTKQISLLVGVLISLIPITGSFIGQKSMQTYYWWGLTQGNISQHTETINVPLLKGIKGRTTEKICYETLYNDIVNNTTASDNIFTFPNCPIIYTLTDRHSITYSKVQWFDVSSKVSIEQDISILSENLPKMIIYVNLPDYVYESHEELFGTYHTRLMRDFIQNELLAQNNYILLHEIDLENNFSICSYLLR